MNAPHETPVPGPAADFAASLAARVPVIDTPRLRLRAPRLTDAPAWIAIFTGPDAPFLLGAMTRDEAFRDFAATAGQWLLRGHGPWTVEDKAEGGVLGFVLIGFEPGDAEPELGYLFLPEARGRGLAFEAAQAARDHALNSLRLPSLVSYVAQGNTRSDLLAQRLGAWADGLCGGCTVWRHHPLPESFHG
jgi:RimJ/RimL family protein N-acetyltransferase